MKKLVVKNLIYSEQYHHLVILFDQMNALLGQMSNEEYQDMTVYLNNLSYMEMYNSNLNALLRDDNFVCWLKERDTELHCNIQATRMAFRMLANLVVNLKQIFTSSR